MESVIERAFTLAKTAGYLSIDQIREQLHREGFSHFEMRAISGPMLRKQLRDLINGRDGVGPGGKPQP